MSWRKIADDHLVRLAWQSRVQVVSGTRSIGDQMPVDGRVVCHRCGGAVEFRWPNENPFWRCTRDHHHRQPLARAHLRLPKMREIIPKTELKKLDRRFNLSATPPGDGQLRIGT